MYDVAISYQNEKYKEAKKIYYFLKSEGWNVFFAPEKQQEMVSERLDVKLYNLYKNKWIASLVQLEPVPATTGILPFTTWQV